MRYMTFCVLAVVLISGMVHAQERAAGSAMETQMTWSALAAKVNQSLSESSAVNKRVDQVTACGKQGMLYAPGKSGANAQGCLKIKVDEVPTDPELTKLLACNAQAMFYMPSHASANKYGCLAPNVKTVTKTVNVAGGCKGLNCTVVVNMAQFKNYPEVSVQATCSGAWCHTNDFKPITSSVKLSTLLSSWSGVWVAGREEGSKNSYIEASYNASSSKMTLQTKYSGKGTDSNLNETTISNIKIIYSYQTLTLP